MPLTLTNLDAVSFLLAEIKRLYAMRWGIETSFRDLKHTLGLLHLHAKKVEFVKIFAKLTMYIFCELITQSVVIQQGQRKYAYKVYFSDAVHVCYEFFLRNVSPPDVEAMLLKYISLIRPGRKDIRKPTQKAAISFTYRVHNFLALKTLFCGFLDPLSCHALMTNKQHSACFRFNVCCYFCEGLVALLLTK